MKFTPENIKRSNLTKSKNGTWVNKKGGPSYYYMDSCEVCGSPYLTQKRCGKIGKYCSYECSVKARVGIKRPELSKKMKGQPPSRQCLEAARQYHLGRKRSKETREKISKSLKSYKSKGVAPFETYAEKIGWANKIRRNPEDSGILDAKCVYCGRWFTPSYRAVRARSEVLNGVGRGDCNLYCSDACKKSCPTFYQMKYPKGYKEASSREVQPELRQMVFKRDNYKCQICGTTNPLHCHHILSVRQNPIESADIDNCITLCKSCHKKVHSQQGCRYSDLRCTE